MQLGDIKLAIVGLGYVGLPLAVEFGKKRSVLGFDINQKRIKDLQSGVDHTLEVSSEELAEAGKLAYSADPAELAKC
ncbi:MAG: Vi polysaccharide biosynthesis UDP-N-acetylglucosamine C-6 dehydrogenase TviB, partial [Advenella sp.]